ncbi:MAG: molybdopterin-binding protein [Rhodothalassiaceae bacterium]
MGNDGPGIVRAALVVIGDEILSGRTRDANTAYLATWLNEIGIRLVEVRIVPDVTECIVEAVNILRARVAYLFTTGGIGPTHDDITADAIAKAFGLPLVENPEAVERLSKHYPTGQFTEARRRMTRMPQGASLIDNPVSIAPGFAIGNVFVLAGVPKIMQAMLDSLRHRLVGGEPLLSMSLAIAMPESALAGDLGAIAARHSDVSIGSYPYYRDGRPGLHVVARATDRARLEAVMDEVRRAARGFGIEPVLEPEEPNG